jgi:hypothetical protein
VENSAASFASPDREGYDMPIWFLVFLAFCACFALIAALRGLRGNGIYIGGERVSPLSIVLSAIIILMAFGIFAAVQLGFIPDHAP